MDFDYVVMPAIVLVVGILVIWLSTRRILSLTKMVSQKWRRVCERIALFVVLLLAVVVIGSASFNAVALLWFRAHNPPPGDTYAVNGHRMHIDCTGSGLPTIILEAGLGNDSLIWGGVQPVLSKGNRVCSYDRAGFGWSDALPAPRDADHIAVELHALLLQAKITGPIVLMGHSIAGIYMRDYATRYPEDIVGIIFVDGSTPLQEENPAFKAVTKGPPEWVGLLLLRSISILGIPRLSGQCTHSVPGFEAHAGKLLTEDICHVQVGSVAAEMDSFKQSGEQTIHTGPYGAIPILIFSHDPIKSLSMRNSPKGLLEMEKAWGQMQEDQKKLSTRSRRIIAKGSSHYIQIDRADLIETEVPLFIQQIRGTALQLTNYGVTITE